MKEAAALQVKTKWTTLADQVQLFTAVMDAALDKAEEAIKADLKKAKDRLADLQTELKEYVSLHGAVISTMSQAYG